jgi:hypothetical protein
MSYTSSTNTPPTLSEVFIDGIPHTMNSTGGTDPMARQGKAAYKGPNVGANAKPVAPGTIIIVDPGDVID